MSETQNNSEQDFEGVAGADDGIPEEGEVTKMPLRITPELLKRDARREVDIVELNLATGKARVVETSDAPKLTKKVLKEKGAPIQTGKTVFDGEKMEVDFYHGVPFALEIARGQLLDTYKDRDINDLAIYAEQQTEVKRLLMAGMIPSTFSYCGEPSDLPAIEDCSDVLLNALWDAYLNLHFPAKDDWYQIRVLRGIPAVTLSLIGKMFDGYPNPEEIPEDAIEVIAEQADAERAILLSSMILHPELSVNGEGNGKHPYPTENLSEGMLANLYSAYRAVNIPAGGQSLLNAFRRSQLQRKRKKRDS